MTQIGEGAASGFIKDNHDEDCPFCRSAKETPAAVENDLIDDFDEDANFAGPLDNDSGKLGIAIMSYKPAPITIDEVAIGLAAHHLIPGNASLAKSKLKTGNHLWQHGIKEGNIGYNVNSEANGVWLPGSFPLNRPNVAKRNAATGAQDPSWTQHPLPTREEYALQATLLHEAQFHDTHNDYNKFLLTVLDKIAAKLVYAKMLNCPEATNAGEQPPGKRPPLKVIVTRLNKLSKRMKDMLVKPSPERWRKNIYTSDKYGPGCLDRAAGALVTKKADAEQLVKDIGFL